MHHVSLNLFGFLLCVLAQQTAAQNGPSASNVRVDAVRMESVENLREVTGELRASRRAMIATEEAGRIIELPFMEGASVTANQILATLDSKHATLEAARAQADVDAARALVTERAAELERAQRDLERLEDLLRRSSAAQNEVDDARTELARVQARLQQSQAQAAAATASLDQAQKRLGDMHIRAPFDAYIVTLETEVGQWVRQGDAVAQLVAIDTLEAWLDVPERFVNRLQTQDASVVIKITALRLQRLATNLQIIPDADPLSRLFPVRVDVDNPGHTLRPGMSIVGLVPTGQQIDVLTVHKDAVLRDDAGQFLYFAADGSAIVARIEQLFPVGSRLAIRSSALRAGMSTITEGNERLFPTAPITIINPAIPQTVAQDN